MKWTGRLTVLNDQFNAKGVLFFLMTSTVNGNLILELGGERNAIFIVLLIDAGLKQKLVSILAIGTKLKISEVAKWKNFVLN